MANYLTGVTKDSIGEVFKNAYEVMLWLSRCAQAVTKHDHYVQWTSPIGFPIMQPYSEKQLKKVSQEHPCRIMRMCFSQKSACTPCCAEQASSGMMIVC